MVQIFFIVMLANLIIVPSFLFPALSCQEVTDDEVLDASCLLDVLRMYRWQISSFEEQVTTTFKQIYLEILPTNELGFKLAVMAKKHLHCCSRKNKCQY